ncbi:ABC transporter substrate-binding protein [Rhodococcus opacus]|uniref:ABC transporter substrate-binding protein n=1 Tax=Rhodococcus opacus TaxID=37919 RepID=UPI001C471823|nr:ABC transporter substrate-binding protein [Rhodococcus opacus]MBV6759073.1 hypothetical protein [Rhodococcus opacus]
MIGVFVVASCSSPSGSGSAADSEISIALSGGIQQLDPLVTSNGTDMNILTNVYETLLSMNPDTGELTPNLATDYDLVDPLTWRFTLREDVEFQDGTPFTADDVKYSLDRIKDPATKSTNAASLALMTETTVVDEHTVEVHFSAPNPTLPLKMQPFGGSGRIFIVSKKYYETNPMDQVLNNPMGTGPYKFDSWRKGSSLTLVKNDDYWGERPPVTKAQFNFITEPATRLNALMSGEVDIIENPPVDDLPRIESSTGTHVASTPNGYVHIISLDSFTAPFDDIRMREAFSLGVDMDTIVESLFGDHSEVLPVPLASTALQYDDSIKPHPYDKEKAASLVEDYESEHGPVKIKVLMSDGRYAADRQIFDAINKQLSDIGIEVDATVMEWGELLTRMFSHTAGAYVLLGYDFGEHDASKTVDILTAGFADKLPADIAELAKESGSTIDTDRRTDVLKKMQRKLHDSFLIPEVWQNDGLFGVRDGIEWEPTATTIQLTDVVPGSTVR